MAKLELEFNKALEAEAEDESQSDESDFFK